MRLTTKQEALMFHCSTASSSEKRLQTQCSVPVTSTTLKSNSAATFLVCHHFSKKKKKKLFWILFVYTSEARIPVEWGKHDLPSKRQMKAWALQRQHVLFPHLKAEWKIPFCSTVDPLLLKGLLVIRHPAWKTHLLGSF